MRQRGRLPRRLHQRIGRVPIHRAAATCAGADHPSFVIPNTKATHLRIEVLTNQCTGTPAYAGDQDDDPLNVTDCAAGSVQDDNVRIAEFQAFAG